jgi:hypothetical protein
VLQLLADPFVLVNKGSPDILRTTLMITPRSTFFPFLQHEKAQFYHNTICAMAPSHKPLSIDSASVESILSSGTTSSPPVAPPMPHVGNSPNRAHFSMAPPPFPIAKHTRALSYTPRVRPNRLSLSLPVATGTNGNESVRATPTSSTGPSFPPTPVEVVPSPNDANGFLVALAGQERRVLELKEELVKAEKDLTKLKKQWANHEAHRKRNEIKHVEPMRALQTVSTNGNSKDDFAVPTRASSEMDRKKLLLSNIQIPKDSRRKVMTGGHHRTLSLLSPERSNYPRPFPPVQEGSSERHSETITRTSTMPDTSQGITRVSSHRARPLSYQGGVTQSAKTIAEDLKAGLWTFMEDLRQATVGDEASDDPVKKQQNLSAKAPVKRVSRGNLRGDKSRKVQSPRSVSPRTWETLTGSPSVGTVDQWSESHSTHPTKTTNDVGNTKNSVSSSLAAPDLDDDEWPSWDSPAPKSPRWSSSTGASDPATPSHENMDDRAVK